MACGTAGSGSARSSGRAPGATAAVAPSRPAPRGAGARVSRGWISPPAGTSVWWLRYPARPEALAGRAAEQEAPDEIVTSLRHLPDREYARVAEVSDALGYGNETRRV